MGRILICSALRPFHNGRLLKTASALLDAGHVVEVAALADGSGELQVDAARFVPLHSLERDRRELPTGSIRGRLTGFIRFRAFATRLVDIFDAITPDAVHMLDYEVLAALQPRLGRVFAVYDAVEFFADTADGSGAAAYVDRLYARSGAKLDRLITVSDALAQELAKAHPALPRAEVILNAARHLSASEIEHARASRDGQLPLAVYQGGFSRGRGLVELIDAAHALKGRWQFALRGWGPEEANIRERVDKLFDAEDPSRPQILAPLPYWELANWTAEASVGIIPYASGPRNHMIATPNKLYEYPAAGVPVVASALPSLQREIETNGLGAVLPVDGFGAALADYLQSEGERLRSGCRVALARFADQHDFWREREKIVAAYTPLSSN